MNDMGIERWVGVAAGLAVGVAVLFYLYGPRIPPGFFQSDEPEPAVMAEAPAPPSPKPAPAPEAAEQSPQYPVPAAEPDAAAPRQAEPVELPPSTDLAASDADVRTAAARVFGTTPVESFLIPDRVIQNFVVTVDSLDRDPVPLKYRAVVNVPEVPVVEKQGDRLLLSSDNDERYRLLADALRGTSARAVANVYLRYYPLLQRAYREIGYPGAHFNDRVVQVIDHLLATPEVEHPIELVRPKVLYLFADPALEELSSGQKILIRIGPANATITKQRLREFREIVAAGKAPATTSQPASTAPPEEPAAQD